MRIDTHPLCTSDDTFHDAHSNHLPIPTKPFSQKPGAGVGVCIVAVVAESVRLLHIKGLVFPQFASPQNPAKIVRATFTTF